MTFSTFGDFFFFARQMWHQAYRNFRETTLYMVTGLELYQKSKYDDAPILAQYLLNTLQNMLFLNKSFNFGFKLWECCKSLEVF